MATCAIYRKIDGAIVRVVSYPEAHNPVNPAMEDEGVFWDCPSDATHIIDGVPAKLTPPPPPPEDLLVGIRYQRNLLLAQCDWTQLPDAPVDKLAWNLYRQQLRDMPSECDPTNPVWPTPPA